MSDVVIGEAVALDLRIAQLPSRLTAAVLDLLVMLAVYGGLTALILYAGLSDADPALTAAVTLSLLVLVFLGYPVAMETVTRGRTLGKMALGLRVVRDDGGPIAFRQAFVRGLVGLVLERPGLVLLGFGPALGMSVAMFSARGKRIGDMAAGTVVLRERLPSRPQWTPMMPPPLAWWAPTLDLTGLDDALALSVREFLGRAGELSAPAREALAAELVDEVRARTTPDPPPGTPGWAYLSAVLAERRRREEDRALRAAGRGGLPPGWYPGWPAPHSSPPAYGPPGYGAPGDRPHGHGSPGDGSHGYGPHSHAAPGYGPPGYGRPGSGGPLPGHGWPPSSGDPPVSGGPPTYGRPPSSDGRPEYESPSHGGVPGYADGPPPGAGGTPGYAAAPPGRAAAPSRHAEGPPA